MDAILKKAYAFTLAILLTGSFNIATADEELPEGFTEEIIAEVMEGKIAYEEVEVEDEENQYQAYHRAFIKTDAKAFVGLAVDHEAYIDLFEEVEDARTTKVSEDGLEYHYSLDLEIKMGFITIYLNGKGRQDITYGETEKEESLIENQILNHKDKIKKLNQNIRLIPYKDGILVEQMADLEMQDDATTKEKVKEYLQKYLNKYIKVFKAELEKE